MLYFPKTLEVDSVLCGLVSGFRATVPPSNLHSKPDYSNKPFASKVTL